MRLLIDGNIILDVLQNRQPHCADSSKVWKMCETALAKGFLSALTFADLVYVMRKELTPDRIEETLRTLSLIFFLVDLQSTDLQDAAALKWSDFEDAVQSVTAARIHADYIITRNVKDYSKSDVPAVTPTEFLERWKEMNREDPR